jgi:hypothetical protein
MSDIKVGQIRACGQSKDLYIVVDEKQSEFRIHYLEYTEAGTFYYPAFTLTPDPVICEAADDQC